MPLIKLDMLWFIPSLPVSKHSALLKPLACLLGPMGVMGRGELCHPGKMRVFSPSFDPISTNSPVTFQNSFAR